jgi:hypothetical protein
MTKFKINLNEVSVIQKYTSFEEYQANNNFDLIQAYGIPDPHPKEAGTG